MDENEVMVNNDYEETEITTVDPEITEEVAEVNSGGGLKKAALLIGGGALMAEIIRLAFKKTKAAFKARKEKKSIEVTAEPVDTETVVENDETSADAPEA